MNLTFSPKVAICSPKNFNSDKFISNVNEALSDLDFLTDDPPPPIPKEIMYEPPVFKVKKLASEIGNILEKAKSETSIKDAEILSSFINFNFDFSTNCQVRSNEIEPLRTVFDFISKNRKNVHYPSPLYPANDTLIVVSIMSSKSTNYELKRQIHQCFAALGSNTLLELAEMIVCPLCKISEVTAGPHCVPEQLEINGKIFYNFNDGFNKPLNKVLSQINCCGNYKSKGGCTHLIVFNGGFAVNVDHDFDQNNQGLDNSFLSHDSKNSVKDSSTLHDKKDDYFNDDDDIDEKSDDDTERNDQISADKDSNGPPFLHNKTSFPVEIAGKGANPPSCFICKVRPGSIVVKDDSFIEKQGQNSRKIENYDDDDDEDENEEEEEDSNEESSKTFPFRFFCQKCFGEAIFDKENAIVIDLTEHFFIPMV